MRFDSRAATMNYVGKWFCAISTASKLRVRRKAHAAFGGMIAIGVAVTLLSELATPVCAQQERWKELIEQGRTLRRQGETAEGIPVAQEALRVAEKTFAMDDANLAISLNLLGLMFDDQGKYADAEPLYKRSLADSRESFGAGPSGCGHRVE